MSSPRQLVLFDIDGTLIKCGSEVKPLFGDLLASIFGTAGRVSEYDFAGKTDDQIVRDVMGDAGVPGDEIESGLPRARAAWAERLDGGLTRERMRLLPGVLETLERLAEKGSVTLGLLTGNWASGARIKLGRFDLNRFFDFGAFGDGVEQRRQLPPRALAAAGRHTGHSFRPEETLIVGDTALDVDCALTHGIPSLAVATGSASAESLRQAGADWVAPDLTAAASLPPLAAA